MHVHTHILRITDWISVSFRREGGGGGGGCPVHVCVYVRECMFVRVQYEFLKSVRTSHSSAE